MCRNSLPCESVSIFNSHSTCSQAINKEYYIAFVSELSAPRTCTVKFMVD